MKTKKRVQRRDYTKPPARVVHLDNLDDSREDATNSIFFARDLEYIEAEVFNVERAAKKIRQLVPVDHSIPEGAQTYTFRQFNRVGAAKFLSDYATNIPMADALGEEKTSKIRQFGIGFRYSTDEIRAAAMAGRPLDRMRAEAAAEAFEQFVDDVGTNGSEDNGLYGFLDQPNVDSHVIVNGASNSPLWTAKDPDEIIDDLNGIVDSIITTTKEVETPDTILLPTAQRRLIASRKMSGTTDKTILRYFLENSDCITDVASWTRLTGAGAGGTDRMVCYKRDPSKLRLMIPLEQRMLAPQPEGYVVSVPTEGKIGGVVVYRPGSIRYADHF